MSLNKTKCLTKHVVPRPHSEFVIRRCPIPSSPWSLGTRFELANILDCTWESGARSGLQLRREDGGSILPLRYSTVGNFFCTLICTLAIKISLLSSQWNLSFIFFSNFPIPISLSEHASKTNYKRKGFTMAERRRRKMATRYWIWSVGVLWLIFDAYLTSTCLIVWVSCDWLTRLSSWSLWILLSFYL